MAVIGVRTASALRATGYCLAAILVYAVCVCTSIGQRLDGATLAAFPDVQGPGWFRVYGARDIIPILLCATAAILAAVSLIRRRIAPAVAAVTLLVVVFAVSRLLNQLPRPALGAFAYAHNTFPSGHAAVSLAAVVAIGWTLPGPRRPRLMAALGTLAFLVAAFSLLSLAHRGSDVVGGTLLAGAVAAGVAAAGGPRATGVRARVRRRHARGLVLTAGIAPVVLVVLATVIAPEAQAPLVGTASLLAVAMVSAAVVLEESGGVRAADGPDRDTWCAPDTRRDGGNRGKS